MDRTVKNGTVKINGKRYGPRQFPNDLPYDGRLDGTCQIFYVYPGDESLAALWNAPSINGFIEWSFWVKIDD